jgi:cytochrome bd-type quinol oxidase subunit 2
MSWIQWLQHSKGSELPQIDLMKRDEYRISTRGLAVDIFIIFLIFLFFLLFMQWMFFLPDMEETYKETKSLIEETGRVDSVKIIHGEYIGEIKFAQVISFICFGLLDTFFAFRLWKGSVLESRKNIAYISAQVYTLIRACSLFMIIILTIVILNSSNPRFFMNLLYVVILIFSMLSLAYIFYFHRRFFGEKTKEEVLFKIPDESPL